MYKIKWLIFLIFLFPFVAFSQIKETSAYAIFAGGCFWCTQSDFDDVPGVIKTIVGYTGGQVANPLYEQVTRGGTGHYEAVKVIYDPAVISYSNLLDFFWHHIDPTDGSGQFCDHGDQYRAVIFYHDEEQKKLALQSKAALIKSKKFAHIATQILAEKPFYDAEEYHQKFYRKNPYRYHFYRYLCRRDQKLAELWGK